MNSRKLFAYLASFMAVLLMVGAHQVTAGAQSSAPPTPGGGPSVADVEKGTLFRQGGSSYPRAVRLANSGDANGRIVVSTTTYVNDAGFAVIYESQDRGETFQQIGEIRDPEGEQKKGMCCSTLFELPQQVGDMPAGTLLWAGTAGIGADPEERQSSIRLWRSDDHGRTWSYLSNVVTPPKGPGVWEPEFTVTSTGELAAFYSDDTDPQHDQKMMQVKSVDGRNWTDLRDTVKTGDFGVRPGMAGVRKLPNGTYVMTYEVCNFDPKHLCATFMRTSRDGWDYGDPNNPGIPIKSDDGKFPVHTPTIAWAPGPGPNGRLILAYQVLQDIEGRPAEPQNGRTLMVNDDPTNLASGWRLIPSPVQIKYSRGSDCRNFSPSVVASEDGKSITHLATDYIKYVGGPCELFYGNGPVESGAKAQDHPHKPLDPGRFGQ
jgi:hypothetical protein